MTAVDAAGGFDPDTLAAMAGNLGGASQIPGSDGSDRELALAVIRRSQPHSSGHALKPESMTEDNQRARSVRGWVTF